MKLNDWAIEQHIVAGEWFAAASAVAKLHGVPPPCPSALTRSRISVFYDMPKPFVALTMNFTKYLWSSGGSIYSGPSLAQGPWAVAWTVRLRYEIERLGDS